MFDVANYSYTTYCILNNKIKRFTAIKWMFLVQIFHHFLFRPNEHVKLRSTQYDVIRYHSNKAENAYYKKNIPNSFLNHR